MRARLAALTALAAATFAAAAPAPAGAHAVLLRAEPADGSRLGSSPHAIRLWFSERIAPRFSSVTLVDAAGRDVLRASGGTVAHAPNELVLVSPRLARGTYTLLWRVLAEDDGHTTSGTVAFGVGTRAVAAGAAAAAPDPAVADVVLRWLRFVLEAAVLGGIAFVAISLRAARRHGHPLAGAACRRVLGVAAAACALGLLVELEVLRREAGALQEGRPAVSLRTTLGDLLLGTRWGTLWLALVVLLAALGALALQLRRRAPGLSRATLAAAAAAGCSLALVEALSSHAAALPRSGTAVAVDAAHLLAASIWIGAVGALALALWPNRAQQGATPSLARAAARPFALLAGSCVLVVAVTGLYAAGLEVASLDGLVTTLYGSALLAKVGLMAGACALGALNFGLLRRPGAGTRRIARAAIVAELAVGAGALLAAGVLTASAPPHGPRFAAPRPVRAPTLVTQVHDLLLSVTVRPDRVGPNSISVAAVSTRRPPPAPIAGVDLRLTAASRRSSLPLRPAGGERWLAAAPLERAGPASLTLLVRRGSERLAARLRFAVEPADPARPVVLSRRPLSSLTGPAAIALLLAAAAAAAAAGVARRARPRRRAAAAPTTPLTRLEEPS
jgi:copper transport protein